MAKLITYAEAKAQGIEDIVFTQEEFDAWLENPIHRKPIDVDIEDVYTFDEEEEVE